MRRIIKREEQEIQRAIVQHFAARGAPGAFWFHVPNGGARSPIEGKILKGQGVVAGVPDIIVLHRGRVYALELKKPGGKKPSDAQLATHEAMRFAGAEVATVYGLDQALAQLEEWGLLRVARLSTAVAEVVRILGCEKVVSRLSVRGIDRRVEVKCRAHGFNQLYEWLDGADFLVVKADRREPLVVLPLKLATELAVRVEAVR